MTLQKLPSGFQEQSSTPEAQDFDYAALDTETRIVVQQRTHEIKGLIRRTAQDIIDIGQKLTEVKEQLGHGSFINWLKSEFNWSESAARKFMQVKHQFKTVNFTDLQIAASALYLLAAPSTPHEARQEALLRANLGETITHSQAKEIVNQHKKAANPKDILPVTVDISPEAVETESSTFAEPAQHTESADRSEPELLAKEVRSAPIESNTDKICKALISNVPALRDDQISSVWQALACGGRLTPIAYRIPSDSLALHNWPDAELKRIIEDAQHELNSRHYPEYFKGKQ